MGNSNDGDTDLVPFFTFRSSQIKFEFFYLIALLITIVSIVLEIHICNYYSFSFNTKMLLYSALGGAMGGWIFVTKWFYRVIARGSKNQYPWLWESHKFYWRMFTPLIASIIALSAHILIYSDLLPIKFSRPPTLRSAFAISIVLGYFSDILLSRLASWVEKMFTKNKAE